MPEKFAKLSAKSAFFNFHFTPGTDAVLRSQTGTAIVSVPIVRKYLKK